MKQKLQTLKKYILTHKKQSLIIGACALIAIIAVIILIVLGTGKGKKLAVISKTGDWDNLIADLEHEPVSEHDEVYKEEKSNREKPYLIKINKSQNCIIVYQKDKQGEYSVPYKAIICSVGADTPVGTFASSDKYTWKIVNGNVWAQYATRVTGNVLIHSMPYSSYDKGTLIADYYNQMGSTLSAGCIRVSARDSEWLMKNCPKGTNVEIYESDSKEPLDRPRAIRVPEDAKWDPTDTDKSNPWKDTVLQFQGIVQEKTIERGSQVNYLEGIAITDTCGNDITAQTKVTTNMDPFTVGTYTVNYHAEDATGKEAEASVTYQVKDTTAPQFCGLKSAMSFMTVADVNKENILKGVTILDNNELLSPDIVAVTIPAVVEGNNAITLLVSDSYGNSNSAIVTAFVDSNPPVVTLKENMPSVLPLNKKVDNAFALSRVTAKDNGALLANDKIGVNIMPFDWGYTIQYTVADANGNKGTLKDTVTYEDYEIVIEGETIVTDLSDYKQLTKNMKIKSTLGANTSGIKVETVTADNKDGTYTVTYSYRYASPLGERTATANAKVTLKKEAVPTATPEPTTPATHEPQTPTTQTPEPVATQMP